MTYRFDGFTLDTDTRRLLRGSDEIHVSGKAFDLLLLLVENHTRLVTRDELQTHLWPSTFVLDTNLATLVKEVRRALGDSARAPRFVRTVHGFGYWFVGDVRRGPAEEEPARPPARCWVMWEARQVPLPDGESILGRAADASVWIDATGVSRHHARIVLAGEEATIEDLGSKNGTFLAERQVTSPVRLADGDEIRLGPVVVTFRIPPVAGATDTTP